MGVTIQRVGRTAWRLIAEQTLNAPRDRVFAFFSDAYNLERLTPSFLRFRVLTPRPIEMRSGAVIDYRLRVRGVPMRWRTVIEDWNPPHSFIDTQQRGPYRLWHHTHTFEDLGESTRCVDTVRYQPPGGPLAELVNAIGVQRDVVRIFEFRMRTLESLFNEKQSEIARTSETGFAQDARVGVD